MKVFQINTVCGVGSTGRIATDLYHVLKKEGHSCCIAYGRGKAPADVDSYKIGSTAEFYLHTFFSRLTDGEGLFSEGATRRLLKKIQEYDPDIIHLHNIHGHYLNYPILFRFLKSYHRPVVWTLHDCWSFTGHCAHFDYVGCQLWQEGCQNCPQLKSYPQSYGIDHSAENYARKKELFTGVENLHIVTPSQWLADLVKKSFLKEYPVTVIHNGIDTSVFKPTESDFRKQHGLENKKILLGVASPWTPRKGLQDFIKLAPMLPENWKIVLVGLSERQLAHLPSNILGLERTNNTKELAQIYTAADVFFNPTYEDNYPTTNLEAIACGTPVITYDTGGSPESAGKKAVTLRKGQIDRILPFLNSFISVPYLNNKHLSKEESASNYIELYRLALQ
ncbi:MAG: glycosyltransferase [Anaerobutyricum sp.]|nr:glycosyltransferase [Anaerobutyricum sp.]